jgi:endonuclease/exonuclease/phosphatase (EEP) superfamily protein YafD
MWALAIAVKTVVPGIGPSKVTRRQAALGCAASGVLLAGIASAVQVVGPRGGGGALISIATPHMLLCALALSFAAVLVGRSKVALISALMIAVGTAAFLGQEWISVPSYDDEGSIEVMSWNLEFGSGAAEQLPAVLESTNADIVALQELTPEAVTAIEGSPAVTRIFPFRILKPDSRVLGLGLLSRLPMRAGADVANPPVITATLSLDDKRTLRLLNAHPLPGRITTVSPLRLPIDFDESIRDAALRTIRRVADRLASAGVPVVVAGDMNVTSTEPAYDELVAGWLDAHVEAGIGPGWTWRPSKLAGLTSGLLRIDYVLVTPDVEPVSSRQDCSRLGDHCIVTVGLRFR